MIWRLLPFIFLLTSMVQAQEIPVSLERGFQPQLVTIDKTPMLYYELHLQNNLRDSIFITRIDIIDPTDSSLRYSINQHELAARIALASSDAPSDAVPHASSAVMYIELKLDKPAESLAHRIHWKKRNEDNPYVVDGASITPHADPIVLGAPLKDGPWAAVYDPAWRRGHRRVFYEVNNKHYLPGRFAIDFIRVDNAGEYARGHEDTIAHWYGYGSDVLAVADGVVVGLRTDFTESPTLSSHQQPGPEDATGNYIAIDIGKDQVAFYEHLKPGSLRVSLGQVVKKGEVIASLGFTGQTTGPHLHFHVANANSPLGAEGIPFIFEEFTLLGKYTNFEDFGKRLWQILKGSHPRDVHNERPGPNSVVRFKQ